MVTSPPYDVAAREGWLCPKCGRVFEVPLTVGELRLAGHPVGHPKLCVPMPTLVDRDARVRRALRRGGSRVG